MMPTRKAKRIRYNNFAIAFGLFAFVSFCSSADAQQQNKRQNYPSSPNAGLDGGITQGGDPVQAGAGSKSQRQDGSIKPPKPKTADELMETNTKSPSGSANAKKTGGKETNSKGAGTEKENAGASKSDSNTF